MIAGEGTNEKEQAPVRTKRFYVPTVNPEQYVVDPQKSVKKEPQISEKNESSQPHTQSQPSFGSNLDQPGSLSKQPWKKRFNLDFLDDIRPPAPQNETKEEPRRDIKVNENSRSNSNLTATLGGGDHLKRLEPGFTESIKEESRAKVKTMPDKKKIPKRPEKTGNPKPKNLGISASEGKLKTRNSLFGPEVMQTNDLGYIVPFSIFRSLFKEIITETYEKDNELRITNDSIHYLKIAAENFMVSKYRLANYITRARGKKTLNRIDLETLDLIQNDPFLRRKSCPHVMIT